MTAKELRAKRAKIISDAQALIGQDGLSAEQLQTFDTMMADADILMGQIERIERADRLASDLGEVVSIEADRRGLSADQVADQRTRERGRLMAFLRGDASQLDDDDRRIFVQRQQMVDPALQGAIRAAASVGTSTAGGYTVEPGFMADLLVAQKAFGGVREVARIINTGTGVDLPWPTMDDTANVATIVGENTAGVAGTDLTFGQKTVKSWTYRSGYLPLSIELLQDSAFDFDSLIRDALALRFARGQNAHFTTGNGTTQPEGILTGGSLGKTGLAGQTTTIIADDLVDLEHSVDPAYRRGSTFMMADSSVKAIKKLKDSTGRPLFLPGYTVGAADTILGYPISVNQDMPAMAASAKSIAFGNFQNYVIRDVMGLRITRLNERFAENGQVAFIAFQRTDGRTVSAASPIKYYQHPAG